MAWQYPTHSCGHQGERYQAYGHHSLRERDLARIESQPCPECRRKEASEQSKATGLPQLTGSDKQIAWGSEIRGQWISSAQSVITTTEQAEAVKRILAARTTAKSWIDGRGNSTSAEIETEMKRAAGAAMLGKIN